MERIILIETSTALCSTAIAEDGVIVSYRESSEPRAHAGKTAQFISEMLEERALKVSDCSAVCVSKGPGSYTGLRVGSSSAKGLCFGAGIPLLSAGTLETLVCKAALDNVIPQGCRYIVPMVDARRMEVYTCVFTPQGRAIGETVPQIVTEDSFADILCEGPVLFIGDGADKCRGVLTSPNAFFHQCQPDARAMAPLAQAAAKEKRYEDIAYFEPFYLKEFVATVSKKNLF